MTDARTEVYLEVGRKRTFAGALEWPGWCRSGRDESAALEALRAYGSRYADALRRSRLGFRAPRDADALVVLERREGDATTDFGAPSIAPAVDVVPLDEPGLRRSRAILGACWRAFDTAVTDATGQDLRKGPRGGGRQLDAIVGHVVEADASYLARLARGYRVDGGTQPAQELDGIREAIVDALDAAVAGEIPERGPRGGTVWPARYFVRRVAWHVLDHAWEIGDRLG
jgi:hypothetical protein